MTITLTPNQPSENDVINGTSIVVQATASSDAGTITGVVATLNNGTPGAMTFDTTLKVWKRSLALALGPSVVKIVATDSVAATATAYINFSRSPSVSPIATILVSHPDEGSTIRSPGVVLQADVQRTSETVKVEASVDQGVTWLQMAIPTSSGGS